MNKDKDMNMNKVCVNIKKLDENARIPVYSKNGDAGMDLTCTSVYVIEERENFERVVFYLEYGTGLSIEIPQGYVGYVFPRSSVSNTKLSLRNSVGVIDSGYRGEIKCRFRVYDCPGGVDDLSKGVYKVGDRVAQIMILPYPEVEFFEVEELSDSERGEGGFGSTSASA